PHHCQTRRRDATTRSSAPPSPPSIDPAVCEHDMAGLNMEELSALIRSIIREEINAVMGKLQPQLDAMKKDISDCSDKFAALEESTNCLETRVSALEEVNETLRKENKELREKADRLENHSWKYNIRILGLPPNVEKGNPTSYVAALMNEIFRDKLQQIPEVENVHRVGPVAKSGQRKMIVWLHRLALREEILRIAKKEKVLEIRGMKSWIYANLTTETVRARASFREVRNQLWKAGVKHRIIHPATLILTYKDETKKFTDHLFSRFPMISEQDKEKTNRTVNSHAKPRN
uniref:L1 transposable element RRM domain-containing protein n=1 Tax=Salarias fasciatus TaxID=181472 RepID=A0A672I4Q0_SALFA